MLRTPACVRAAPRSVRVTCQRTWPARSTSAMAAPAPFARKMVAAVARGDSWSSIISGLGRRAASRRQAICDCAVALIICRRPTFILAQSRSGKRWRVGEAAAGKSVESAGKSVESARRGGPIRFRRRTDSGGCGSRGGTWLHVSALRQPEVVVSVSDLGTWRVAPGGGGLFVQDDLAPGGHAGAGVVRVVQRLSRSG